MHEGELDIGDALVRRPLAEQLPQRAALTLRRVDSGGTDNAVFRLGDDLCVRIPVRADAVGGVLKQVRWLPVIAPHLSLDVPAVVAVGEPGAGYPFPWAVVRWLPGEDASTARIESLHQAALALGQVVMELRASIATRCPRPGRKDSSAACRWPGWTLHTVPGSSTARTSSTRPR